MSRVIQQTGQEAKIHVNDNLFECKKTDLCNALKILNFISIITNSTKNLNQF